jgi:hypothetical protein
MLQCSICEQYKTCINTKKCPEAISRVIVGRPTRITKHETASETLEIYSPTTRLADSSSEFLERPTHNILKLIDF